MTDHRPRVRELVDSSSLHRAARQLRLAPQTIAKYVAGLPIAEATELLIDARMREYELAQSEQHQAAR